MKEPYMKVLATHHGPESCGGRRKATREALTGESTGRAIELRKLQFRAPIPLLDGEGKTEARVKASGIPALRSLRTGHVWTSYAREPGDPANSLNRLAGGTAEEGKDPNAQRERLREVGQRRSTSEAGEQSPDNGMRSQWREGR